MLAMLSAALVLLSAEAGAASTSGRACPVDLGEVECGVVAVPEGSSGAKTFPLDYIILRANGSHAQPKGAPLVVLQGGPGQSVTGQASYYEIGRAHV